MSVMASHARPCCQYSAHAACPAAPRDGGGSGISDGIAPRTPRSFGELWLGCPRRMRSSVGTGGRPLGLLTTHPCEYRTTPHRRPFARLALRPPPRCEYRTEAPCFVRNIPTEFRDRRRIRDRKSV